MFINSNISQIMITNINIHSGNRHIISRFQIRNLRPISTQIATRPSRLFTNRSLNFLYSIHRNIIRVPSTIRRISSLLVTRHTCNNNARVQTRPFSFFSRPVIVRLLNTRVSTVVRVQTIRIRSSLRKQGRMPMTQRANQVQFANGLSSLRHASNTT